jgi:hypothetical protein
MPRIYLEGQLKEPVPVPDTPMDIEMIWKDIENYRGKHDVLKLLFKDLDKPVFDLVSNGKHVVTRNVHGITRKVMFYLYTKDAYLSLLKYSNSPSKQKMLDKIINIK